MYDGVEHFIGQRQSMPFTLRIKDAPVKVKSGRANLDFVRKAAQEGRVHQALRFHVREKITSPSKGMLMLFPVCSFR